LSPALSVTGQMGAQDLVRQDGTQQTGRGAGCCVSVKALPTCRRETAASGTLSLKTVTCMR
jgi:hypothetical protein